MNEPPLLRENKSGGLFVVRNHILCFLFIDDTVR